MKEKYNPIYTIVLLIIIITVCWGASKYNETSFWVYFIPAILAIIVNNLIISYKDKKELGEIKTYQCETCNKEYRSYSEITCTYCKKKLCDDHFAEYRMHQYSRSICNGCYKEKEFQKLINSK